MGEGWRLEREGREEPTDKLGESFSKKQAWGVGRILGPKEVEWGRGERKKRKGKGKRG